MAKVTLPRIDLPKSSKCMSRFSRREFNSLAVCSSMSAVLAGLVRTGDALAAGSIRARAFAHPGMLHSAQDLAGLRAAVTQRQQPIYAGFEALRDDPHSQLTYRPLGGFEEVGRNPTVHVNEFDSDANAAYQCALMGHFTGDEAYFQLCAKILDA